MNYNDVGRRQLTFWPAGTGIAVFATTDSTSGGVVTSYSIDDGTPVPVTALAGSGDTYKQQLWKSPTLPSQDQCVTILSKPWNNPVTYFISKLVVQMVKVNSGAGDGEGTVWFDYFQVDNDPGQSSIQTDLNSSKTEALPPSTLSSSSYPASFSASSTTSSSQNNQTTLHDASSKPSKSNSGPIIGGFVGGVILLLLLLFLLFSLRRRSKKKALENWVQQKPEIDRNQPYCKYLDLLLLFCD